MLSVEFLVLRRYSCYSCVLVVTHWVFSMLMILLSWQVGLPAWQVSLLFLKMIVLYKL